MAYFVFVLCSLLSIYFGNVNSTILCDNAFCRNYEHEVGCPVASINCRIPNATHTGLWLPSPSICNCCDYCLPFFVEGAHCSVGGPGSGTTIGRCGYGLTCVAEDDGNFCRRMNSPCHSAQDDYDQRHQAGNVGALERRPECDGKGRYVAFDCVPAHSCFCQSETGDRLFGEVPYVGTNTAQNMHCGCSRFHDTITKMISASVPNPVVGPRCTSDGNYSPVQCVDRHCHCVHRVTGAVVNDAIVDLDEKNITRLPCYVASEDLFPQYSRGDPPYDFTTPCIEDMNAAIEFIEESREAGFNVNFGTYVPPCMPDGTYGRIIMTRNGTKICVDEWGEQIQDFEAKPGTPEFEDMDCKCAQTLNLMSASVEQPQCCHNGNYRRIQCRRGLCRCVDADGRQVGRESSDVESLNCYQEDWRLC